MHERAVRGSSDGPAEQPLVTIIICAHNAGGYLRSSLASALSQTYGNLEIIIVDDGSTDGAVESLRRQVDDRRVRWLRQANAGKSVALNRALKQMRGEFYAIQDADDASHQHRIERQVRAMQTNPEVAAVFCGHDLLIDDRRLAPRFRARGVEECRRDIQALRMPAHDPTAMYRWSMVLDLRYDEDLLIGQGYDYILRVGERSPMLVIGECLYSYRVQPGSVTRKDPGRRARFVAEVQARARARRGIAAADQAETHLVASVRRDNNIAAHFMESACDLARSGRRLAAVKVGLACAWLHPAQLHYQKALVYALSPQWLVRRLRPSES